MPLVPAAYPMVDETEATGLVADVYRDILRSFPMVPSLYKSLAVCPVTLALAWAQSRDPLGGDALADAARDLVARLANATPPPPDADARGALADFVPAIARMLVVTAGLHLALADRLDAPPARTGQARAGGGDPPQPSRTVPSTTTAGAAAIFGEIRRDLSTPIINSVWRTAAKRGVLEDAWSHLGPRARRDDFADVSATARRDALEAAATLDWRAAASPAAFDLADAADALAGARAVVEAYLTTLARVAPLVAGAA